MAHELALALVNDIKTQLAKLAKAIVEDLRDGRLSASERMELSIKGMMLALSLTQALEGRTKQLQDDILLIFEDGIIVLPNDTVTAMHSAEAVVPPETIYHHPPEPPSVSTQQVQQAQSSSAPARRKQ